ncbi:MAG: hypothetical protein QOJ19_2 [Acidimicrobiia bacterium]|jgi:hypothetical protein|nr:hypothetical protein [Acidimicrobiia bacterium]
MGSRVLVTAAGEDPSTGGQPRRRRVTPTAASHSPYGATMAESRRSLTCPEEVTLSRDELAVVLFAFGRCR